MQRVIGFSSLEGIFMYIYIQAVSMCTNVFPHNVAKNICPDDQCLVHTIQVVSKYCSRLYNLLVSEVCHEAEYMYVLYLVL